MGIYFLKPEALSGCDIATIVSPVMFVLLFYTSRVSIKLNSATRTIYLIMAQHFLRSHIYDMESRIHPHPKRRRRRISSFGATARGAEGVRTHHKTNEEKILAHRRLGIKDNDLFNTNCKQLQ